MTHRASSRLAARRAFAARWLVMLGVCAAPVARSAPAPLLEWRTISTTWCDVHFHLEVEPTARRAAAVCDESLEATATMLDAVPSERIQVVVADTDDRTNGWATSVPYNHITLLTVGPDGHSELAHSDDHIRLVLLHEMFHIVHLEIQSGLPRLVNSVLGKVWPPNLVQPRFIVEGMAVYAESRLTDGGRLRTDQAEALLRVAALEDDLWSLDDLSNYSRRPPGGNAAYLYGGAFAAFIVERHGEEALGRLAREYGGFAVPFGLQRAFKRALGVDLTSTWDEFRAHLKERASRVQALVDGRAPHAPARRLTTLGATIGRASFGPDGTLWFVARPPNGAASLFRITGLPDGAPRAEAVVRVNASGATTVLDDGTVVFDQMERFESRFLYSDLFAYGRDGTLRQLTHGARVRGPRVLPDGKGLLAIRRTGVDNALVIVDGSTGAVHEVKVYADGTQLLEAAPHPRAGRAVVLEHRPGGGRALVEIDLDDGTARPLVHDAFDLLDPVYALDGSSVLFSSSRSGVFNIERVRLDDGRRELITNTLGLASAPVPTPDGRGVVFLDIDVAGDDLFAVPLAGADDDHAGDTVVQGPLPPGPDPRPLPSSTVAARPYNPLPTLLPRTWMPTLGNDATGSLSFGVTVSGDDAVGINNWVLQTAFDLGFLRPQVSFAWRFAGFFTPLTVGADLYTDLARFDLGNDEIVTRRETVLRTEASATFPVRRWLRDHSFAVGYSRSLHFIEDHKVAVPDGPAPVLPLTNNIGSLNFGWAYSDVLRFRDEVSSTTGQAFSTRLRMSNAFTLSELDLYEWTLDGKFFRPVPGLPQHVVALYMSGGWTFGARFRRANFRLGGFEVPDLTADFFGNRRFGGGALRGYPVAAAVGDGFMFTSFEYRFPLVEIERGIESLPLQATRISGAAFVDVGDAFDGFPRIDRIKVGVGGEVRAELLIGYYGSLLLRAGYARGLMAGGTDQPYVIFGVPY